MTMQYTLKDLRILLSKATDPAQIEELKRSIGELEALQNS